MLTHDDIRAIYQTDADHILSLYLNVDRGYQPNQSETPAWQIYVKNALRDLKTDGDNYQDAHRQIQKHIQQYLEDYTPSSRTLALFVSPDGIIQDVELPLRSENQHTIDAQADVVPLLWAIDEYERYLVVLVDSEQARFFSAYLGSADANEEFNIDFDEYDFRNKQFIYANQGASGDGLQGSGGDNFENMKAEHVRRFHDDVATNIREFINDMDASRVILGGNEKAAHQVKDLLHQSITKQVVDILALPMTTNPSEIEEAIRQSATNYERSEELDLVNEVISFAESGGRGAIGIDEVRQALQHQQVDLLILPYPMEDNDLARELSLLALENNTTIELVHGSASARLNQDAPVAARLYYAVPQS
ncbi:MAG: VLRF1 family aeRF1-type release factor [Chloroflexota bacterium]